MNGDKEGSMPFALVAVTILVMSVACGAVMASYERASDSTDVIENDNGAADEAIVGIERHIEMGLGEIILGLSTDRTLGTLDDRAGVFTEKAGSWLDYQFPISDHGVRADLVSHDISLVAENMMSQTGEDSEDGYVPAYLRAVGTVKVSMKTSTGHATADVEISTDGSYALPLISDQGSLFEKMTSDGGISLSQMMEYQLTCLAQTRVMNGYGALSEHGSKGTSQILTRDDVEKAYRNAVSAIGLICFRTETGDIDMSKRIDLADILVAEDGKVSIDIGLVYAQAVAGELDDVVLGWYEYFCGDRIHDLLSPHDREMQLFGDMISSLVKGESVIGAESYIRKVMSGYPESVYRYPGSGSTSGTIGGFQITVNNPTADLFGQKWIRNFKLSYHLESDPVMDHLRSVINLAVSKMADRSGHRAIVIEVDSTDSTPFSESLSTTLREALRGYMTEFETDVRDSLESASFADPFYGSIADAIDSHSSSFILEREFRERIGSALSDRISDETGLEELMSSDDVDKMVRTYTNKVLRDLQVFEDLRNVPGKGPGIADDLLASLASIGLGNLGILIPIQSSMERVCSEMVSLISMNPHGGITDLPGTHGFRLSDEDGNMTAERISASISSDPVIERPLTVDGKCVHTVGFGDDNLASYSTVFRVSIKDNINYSLEGTGTLSDSMGTISSALEGKSRTDMTMYITVSSAWALAGVDYRPSCTILSDIEATLLKIIEPLIEPLTYIMGLVRGALTEIGERLMEIGRQVAEAVATMYERMMEPIEMMNGWIMENLDRMFTDSALDLMMGIGLSDQYIVAEVMGYTLRLETNALSLKETTKTLFSLTLSGPIAGMNVSAGITVKNKGDVNRENLIITGNGSIAGDGWSVKAKVDPLMKGSKYFLSLDGEVDDTDISLTIPELVDYHDLGVRLSDVPGIGRMLDNIPLPALGMTASIDAGFTLRYSAPIQSGLLINEFESNPPGDDNGNEWVEILNNTSKTIDLDGYTLSASSDWRKKTMDLSGTISPGERIVINPTFMLVNSSGKYTKNGEALVLRNPEGETADKTPTKKDGANDGNTWQRRYDGSTEWVFNKGTKGEPNSPSMLESVIPATEVKDLVWNSVEKAFGDVEYITDLETLELFMKSLIKNILESVIEKVTARIVDASVFISVDAGDVTGVSKTGVRLAITAEGDLAGDVLRFAAGKLQQMILGVKNPYRIDPVGMFTENIGLEVMFHTSVGFPRILSDGIDNLPSMDLGVTFRASISSLTRVLGTDTGKPVLMCGVTAFDCPTEIIPEKMNPNRNMDHDLWLMRLTVTWA